MITNSPTYDWHMTNLRNYVNFSIDQCAAGQARSVTLTPFGQGSGMLGLPGDFTPPSRFVRAVAFSQSACRPNRPGEAAVLQAFHILNNFDIPKGAAREAEKDEHGNILADYTIWTSAIDLNKREYYFRTYDNSQIRSVTLSDFAIDGPNVVMLPIGRPRTDRADETLKAAFCRRGGCQAKASRNLTFQARLVGPLHAPSSTCGRCGNGPRGLGNAG